MNGDKTISEKKPSDILKRLHDLKLEKFGVECFRNTFMRSSHKNELLEKYIKNTCGMKSSPTEDNEKIANHKKEVITHPKPRKDGFYSTRRAEKLIEEEGVISKLARYHYRDLKLPEIKQSPTKPKYKRNKNSSGTLIMSARKEVIKYDCAPLFANLNANSVTEKRVKLKKKTRLRPKWNSYINSDMDDYKKYDEKFPKKKTKKRVRKVSPMRDYAKNLYDDLM